MMRYLVWYFQAVLFLVCPFKRLHSSASKLPGAPTISQTLSITSTRSTRHFFPSNLSFEAIAATSRPFCHCCYNPSRRPRIEGRRRNGKISGKFVNRAIPKSPKNKHYLSVLNSLKQSTMTPHVRPNSPVWCGAIHNPALMQTPPLPCFYDLTCSSKLANS